MCVYIHISARKFSWNPAGVEPVHWKVAHIDSRVSFALCVTSGTWVETPHQRSCLGEFIYI